MKARLLAAAPLGAALLLYVGIASPLRARAVSARDAYGQARREKHQAQAQLAPLERRENARRQAAAVFTSAASSEGGAAAALRRAVLATLEGSGASGVRLGVRPGAREATVRLSTRAAYPDAVRLSGEIARAGTGLILQRVRLEPRGDDGRIALDVEAVAVQGQP